MMYYCSKCRRLNGEAVCRGCGSGEMREAVPEDLCLLTEAEHIRASVLAEALEREGIPFITEDVRVLDTVLAMPSDYRRRRFFVNCEHLDRAEEIHCVLFSEDAENTAPLGETETTGADPGGADMRTETHGEAVIAAFSGELSGEARGRACRYLKGMNGFVYSFAAGAAFCFALALLLFFDASLWFVALPILLLPLLALLPVSKTGMQHYPTDVTVSEHDIRIGATKTFAERWVGIEEVRTVEDAGAYYVIRLSGFKPTVICEKGKLTEGSLEEFEKLFEGKFIGK